MKNVCQILKILERANYNMKKLLYISPTSFDYADQNGVPKKILNQSNAFVGFGYKVDILSYHEGMVKLYHVNSMTQEIVIKGASKIDVLRSVPRVIKGYSYVYIRYPMSDFLFLHTLKCIKREGNPIIVEIPTYPYDSEGKESLKGRTILALDKLYRKKLQKYVDRICTYSNDKVIYSIPTINTINGYDFSRIEPDEESVNTRECIRMIAVSNMWPLHGYDRLIKGLGDYYSTGGSRNIELNIVGSGYVEQEWKELTASLGLQGHVIFHGKVFGDDLMTLYKGQALGVNSLAIHRDNLLNESTLKTKEYAALGLPIISSSYVDAFSKEGNDLFTLRVPADESNINVKALISFVDNLYENPTKQIRDAIRKNGKSVCDMSVTLKPVVDFYESTKSK